jgi:hypothetical protein
LCRTASHPDKRTRLGHRPEREPRPDRLNDAHVSPIYGDPDRLRQIIWNLLTNAIKFTPEGGRVEVGLERTGSHVEVTISDTGQGIAPEFLPHVFERFSQSDSSSTRRHGGLGLGLSIVRQLVELHGGTVTATSAGRGEGTTFKVIIPLMSVRPDLRDAEVPPPLTGSSPLTDRQPSLNDLRVLIVEDAPDVRELLVAMLGRCGTEAVAVGSAVEALEEMERQRFDVMISDIGMPLVDGYALIEKVRRLPLERGGGIPAVALTAYAGVEDRMRMLSAGYQMHLPKPVESIELTTVVATLAAQYAEPLGV